MTACRPFSHEAGLKLLELSKAERYRQRLTKTFIGVRKTHGARAKTPQSEASGSQQAAPVLDLELEVLIRYQRSSVGACAQQVCHSIYEIGPTNLHH